MFTHLLLNVSTVALIAMSPTVAQDIPESVVSNLLGRDKVLLERAIDDGRKLVVKTRRVDARFLEPEALMFFRPLPDGHRVLPHVAAQKVEVILVRPGRSETTLYSRIVLLYKSYPSFRVEDVYYGNGPHVLLLAVGPSGGEVSLTHVAPTVGTSSKVVVSAQKYLPEVDIQFFRPELVNVRLGGSLYADNLEIIMEYNDTNPRHSFNITRRIAITFEEGLLRLRDPEAAEEESLRLSNPEAARE